MPPRILPGALLVLLLCVTAWADTGRDHFNRGMDHYRAAHYAAAFLEFKAAYELTPQPGLLLWLGHASLKRRDGESALAYYERYLQEKPDLLPEQRQTVEDSMAQARALRPVPSPRTDTPVAPPAAPASPAGDGAAGPRPQAVPATAVTQAVPSAPAQVPVYKRWWLWTTLGLVAAAGVTTAVVLTLPKDQVNDPCATLRCFDLGAALTVSR